MFSSVWCYYVSAWMVFWKKRSSKLSLRSVNQNQTGVEVAMLTKDLQALWDQMSPDQRARIIAILVEMLLHRWNQETEAHNES